MQKANYATPELHVYGNIGQLTQANKTWGTTDGSYLDGQPIKDAPPSGSGGNT